MQCAARKPGCAGFVLAGGRSSRMGTDKALVELAGRPLIACALDVLRAAGASAAIAGAHSDLSAFAPVVTDAQPDRGPLGGVCAALEECETECAVFVSVDMPLMPSALIAYLMEHAAITGHTVTLAAVNGFAQTFPVVIRREALATLRAELTAGRGGTFAALQAAAQARGEAMTVLPVELLVQSGHVAHPRGMPPARWFLNVNTRKEMARASAYLAAAIA